MRSVCEIFSIFFQYFLFKDISLLEKQFKEIALALEFSFWEGGMLTSGRKKRVNYNVGFILLINIIRI